MDFNPQKSLGMEIEVSKPQETDCTIYAHAILDKYASSYTFRKRIIKLCMTVFLLKLQYGWPKFLSANKLPAQGSSFCIACLVSQPKHSSNFIVGQAKETINKVICARDWVRSICSCWVKFSANHVDGRQFHSAMVCLIKNGFSAQAKLTIQVQSLGQPFGWPGRLLGQ